MEALCREGPEERSSDQAKAKETNDVGLHCQCTHRSRAPSSSSGSARCRRCRSKVRAGIKPPYDAAELVGLGWRVGKGLAGEPAGEEPGPRELREPGARPPPSAGRVPPPDQPFPSHLTATAELALRAGVPSFWGRGGRSRQCRSRRGSVGRAKPRSRAFPCLVPQTATGECWQSAAFRRLLQRDRPALSRSRGGEGTAAFGAFGLRWRAAGHPGRISATSSRCSRAEEMEFFKKYSRYWRQMPSAARTENAGGRGSRPHAAPRVQDEHAGLVEWSPTPPSGTSTHETKPKTRKAFKKINPGDLEADRRWTVCRQSAHHLHLPRRALSTLSSPVPG